MQQIVKFAFTLSECELIMKSLAAYAASSDENISIGEMFNAYDLYDLVQHKIKQENNLRS